MGSRSWHQLTGALAQVVPLGKSRGTADSGPITEVFPWLGHAAGAGLLLGAALAGTLGWMGGHETSGVILRGILGAVAGGLFGAFIAAMLWAVEVPPRAQTVPTPAGPEALWDPWLDEGPGRAGPGIRAGEDGPGRGLVPERARVRPRVLSPEGGESMPLDDEVLPLVAGRECGAIRIAGPPGSGKTTTLRHLAAVLPPELGVSVLDEPDRTVVADRSAAGLVVYASNDSAHPKHLATYHLAPWGDDELIEYLLAADRGRCASVMARLKGTTDRGLLQGCPELWRIVLDRMAADESLTTARHALRRELAGRLSDQELRTLAEALCLALLATPDAVPAGHRELLKERCRDEVLLRLLRHRPVQIVLAAGRIAADLGGDAPCAYLGGRLPRELVQEAASLIRGNPGALAHLTALLAGADRQPHPMAASLRHATQTGWRPEGQPIPRLSGAYLDRAAWPGIDLTAGELDGADLHHADLTGARLDGAQVQAGRLHRAVLRGASLAGAALRGADLLLADLSSIRAGGAQLQGANLERANLRGASLRKASLGRANLTGAQLTGADLTRADLDGAIIEGTDFTGAILAGAVLKGLRLRRADFTGAHFTGADLRGCDLEGMDLPAAAFQGARLQGALLTGSRMPGGDFRGAGLQEAGLAAVEWERARLGGADLRRASFHMGSSRGGLVHSPIACEGSRTGFYTDDYDEQDFKPPEEIRKANLCGADLRGARIQDVDFYLVDLRGAVYDLEQARHFRRCGAILENRC